jgi:hypothetical protein
LLLPGWEESSVWGEDGDHLFAQVTRNGVSDDDGPEFWITPGGPYPEIRDPATLARAINGVTGVPAEVVLTAMVAGVAMEHSRAVPGWLVAGEMPQPTPLPVPATEQNTGGEPEWSDLAGNTAGRQVVVAANQARRDEGAGADRSWRVGAEGEHRIAEALTTLNDVPLVHRLMRRPRPPRWEVLHSIPVGTGRGDIDHVVIGPPGVFTINTKHHPGRRIDVENGQLFVGGRAVDYLTKARAEANRARRMLCTALAREGHSELANRLKVRAVLAVVGARLLVRTSPDGVLLATETTLVRYLQQHPAILEPAQVATIYTFARRSTTWTQ